MVTPNFMSPTQRNQNAYQRFQSMFGTPTGTQTASNTNTMLTTPVTQASTTIAPAWWNSGISQPTQPVNWQTNPYLSALAGNNRVGLNPATQQNIQQGIQGALNSNMPMGGGGLQDVINRVGYRAGSGGFGNRQQNMNYGLSPQDIAFNQRNQQGNSLVRRYVNPQTGQLETVW